jgi:hypothetical protein
MITGLHHLGLVFRDPGNIQLELFFEPSQMASP